MLSSYFQKPVGKKEGIFIFIVASFLIVDAMIFGWNNFFGIDACYRGLFADLSDWYAQDCETGERINEAVGRIWSFLTLAIIPALFVKNILLRILLVSALFIQFLYFFVSHVFYFFLQEDGQLAGHIFSLITILLWLYFVSVVFRKYKHNQRINSGAAYAD